jgi:hypothetical protein
MSETAAQVGQQAQARLTLADELGSAVLGVSEQVATAATEMGASAHGRATFARDAVTSAERGRDTVGGLQSASDQIRRAVDAWSTASRPRSVAAGTATRRGCRSWPRCCGRRSPGS